jgi:hypothetical protein
MRLFQNASVVELVEPIEVPATSYNDGFDKLNYRYKWF